MSKARTDYAKLGEECRQLGIDPPPEMCDPATMNADSRSLLDGWLGDSWRRRLFGTNFCRVLILRDRLVAVRDRREDLFARSAA